MDSPGPGQYNNDYFARYGIRPPLMPNLNSIQQNLDQQLREIVQKNEADRVALQNDAFRRQSAAIFPNVVPRAPAPLLDRASILPGAKSELSQEEIHIIDGQIMIFKNEIHNAMKDKNEFFFIDQDQLSEFQRRLQKMEDNYICSDSQIVTLRSIEKNLRDKVHEFEAFALSLQEQNRMGPSAPAPVPVPKAPVTAQDLFKQISLEAAAKRELRLQPKPAAALPPEPKPLAVVAPVAKQVAMPILKPKVTPVAASVLDPVVAPVSKSPAIQNVPAVVEAPQQKPVAAPVSNVEKSEAKDLDAQKRIAELEQKLKLYEGLVTQLKEHMECPITMELMIKPVVDEYGHSYSSEGISDVMAANGKAPIANKPYTRKEVVQNVLLATVFDNINEFEKNLGKVTKLPK